jgi:hypothetical protein
VKHYLYRAAEANDTEPIPVLLMTETVRNAMRRAFMMTKNIIVVAAMFMFALTVGILTANLAESGNDRVSGPTIGMRATPDSLSATPATGSIAAGGVVPTPSLVHFPLQRAGGLRFHF